MRIRMTSFFPDVNVWLALSDGKSPHNKVCWKWFRTISPDAHLFFCRVTQIGLLRLLSNQAVMGSETLTLEDAWRAYDFWTSDPRVELRTEPHGIDATFRDTAMHFGRQPASKMVGDCYLLAYAAECGATLVTFDKGLLDLARKRGYAAICPV